MQEVSIHCNSFKHLGYLKFNYCRADLDCGKVRTHVHAQWINLAHNWWGVSRQRGLVLVRLVGGLHHLQVPRIVLENDLE